MKKAFTAIIVVIVALGMIASYVFSGAPIQPQPVEQQVQPSTFKGPSGPPSVQGPSASAPIQ
jgi:hypothetical protein